MLSSGSSFARAGHEPGPPLWLLAELTYRCPLQCPYCSNPLDFSRQGAELSTAEWIEVFRQARELGRRSWASPVASRWCARIWPS